MWILFAAPFVLLAAVVFSVLSVLPAARKWALAIPTGILGAGPSSLVGLGACALWIHYSESRMMGRSFLIVFLSAGAVTGLVGGIVIWGIARWLASLLSPLLLRLAVFLGGWCSYFAVMSALLLWADARFGLQKGGVWAVSAEVVVALVGAWLISEKAGQFRPRRRMAEASTRGW